MSLGRLGAVAGVLLAAASIALVSNQPARDWARTLAKRVYGYPAWRRRSSLHEARPFQGLAASQVGYAPRARKLFTSPRPYRSFQVLREADGVTVLGSSSPPRALSTDVLGGLRTVWVGDFSALQKPGRYRIALDDRLTSYPFDVSVEVFDPVVRAVQRALYYQRAFTPIEPTYAEGPWTHPSDGGRAPPGVRGGWHDAGDFSLYSLSTNATIFWLLETYSDFAPTADDTHIPESGNGVPDLLDEARWGLSWLLSVQEISGGFRNSTCAERYGPYGTNWPERGPPYRDGEAGTIPTARAVGTLAYASSVFRTLDPAFSARCLAAAQRGESYLEARGAENSDGPTCPSYRLSGNAQVGHDVRAYAAAGMLLATGDSRYRRTFEAHLQDLENDPSAFRLNWHAALLYLRAPGGEAARKESIWREIKAHAERARRDGQAHPFGWAARYYWGSISAAFQLTNAFNAKVCLANPELADDCEQALANVHYVLGRNFLQFCYLSGLPGVTHARQRAFHQWLRTLRAKPFLFPGLVAGGPVATPEPGDISYPHARPWPLWGYWGDPAMPRDGSTPLDGRYTDNDSWSTNEVGTEWQAVTLYALYFARWWALHTSGTGPRP